MPGRALYFSTTSATPPGVTVAVPLHERPSAVWATTFQTPAGTREKAVAPLPSSHSDFTLPSQSMAR